MSSGAILLPDRINSIGAVRIGPIMIDPDFDPALATFYKRRVIETPTPRWTARNAVAFDFSLGTILATQRRINP